MKIVVCIRQGLDGEINPFDACAYEAALRIEGAEVTVLSMAAATARDFLLGLTRLGAKKAILLSDKAFAGADTLATAYTLSLAIKKLSPDLVFCGRQTLVGDTAQTGAMLSVLIGYNLITNVMGIESADEKKIVCQTREEGIAEKTFPALITVERINELRLPRLRSKLGEIEIWDAAAIGADVSRCGLVGSPTGVGNTFENESGKRKCKFIPLSELETAVREGLKKREESIEVESFSEQKLEKVCIIGEAPRSFAKTVSDNIIKLDLKEIALLAQEIKTISPNAVIWGSDTKSKRISAEVAAMLGLGLCADCTSLECRDGELFMYRPALSGSIIAKIRSTTSPAMATVRTESREQKDVIIALGYGACNSQKKVMALANNLGAEVFATRKAVDNGYMPYSTQVGLTGKTVSPPVYIAIGVSGAVHHIVGMQRSGTVIAINPDKDAPIFEYADFGIIDKFE